MDAITKALIELNKIGNKERAEDRETERLKTAAEGLGGQGYGGEPHGGNADRMADATAKLIEHRAKVKAARRERFKRKTDALKTVWSSLDGGAAFVALSVAYEGKNFKDISDAAGMSERWAYLQIEQLERNLK